MRADGKPGEPSRTPDTATDAASPRPETRSRWWLIPSRHDPRNAWLAKYAAVVAMVEWVYVCGGLSMPFAWSNHPIAWFVVHYSCMLLLLMWGIRGMVSGWPNRVGSFLLFSTNLPLCGALAYATVLQYLQYVR